MTDDSEPLNRPQSVVGSARDHAKGDILPFHRHGRAQLVYASQGTMTVKTRAAAFVVPPQRAVWMPAEVEHAIEARSAFSMRSLYVDPAAASDLPASVCVLQVTPLLRELIATFINDGNDYETDSVTARIAALILDQIRVQPSLPSLVLPMPTDPRLQRITRALIDDPADPRELAQWSQAVGASTRTLVRLFPAQTGMTFREWRQQRRLMRALELLASGESVTGAALELGYESSSAFIAMFRRCLGTTPKRYLEATF